MWVEETQKTTTSLKVRDKRAEINGQFLSPSNMALRRSLTREFTFTWEGNLLGRFKKERLTGNIQSGSPKIYQVCPKKNTIRHGGMLPVTDTKQVTWVFGKVSKLSVKPSVQPTSEAPVQWG